jgi:AcrR family transcriptional regulator
MARRVKQPPASRTYHAPRRTAAATETRQAILRAATEQFETRGWAATTIASVAMGAGVSPKTVEALFATKPALLETTLLAAFGGYAANGATGGTAVLRPDSVLEMRRDARLEIERATDAATMLELHSAESTEVNTRVARICWAVETAVPCDERLAELLARLTETQIFGVRWSAETLLQKPGVRAGLTMREAEEAFLIGIDWNTYRTLTTKGGMRPDEAQAWLTRYYRGTLLG